MIAFKDATATYFVIKDHLGSIRVLFRSIGSQYSTYDYSPFGSLMRATINGDVVYKVIKKEKIQRQVMIILMQSISFNQLLSFLNNLQSEKIRAINFWETSRLCNFCFKHKQIQNKP